MIIRDHSIKIGFDEESATTIDETISKLAQRYLTHDLAISIFEESYPKYVRGLFSNEQFKTFNRVVERNSFKPKDEEFVKGYRSLGIGIRSPIWMTLNEKAEYIEKSRAEREIAILTELQKGYYYEILNNIVLRKLQKDPNFRLPFKGFISVPTGGQPGYRR